GTISGNLIDAQLAGVSKFSVSTAGNLTAAGTYNTNTFTGTALTFAGASPVVSGSSGNTNITIQAAGSGNVVLGGGSNTQVSVATSTLAGTSAATFTVQSAASQTLALNGTGGTVQIGGSTISLTSSGPTISNTTGQLTLSAAGALVLQSASGSNLTVTAQGAGLVILGDATNGITLAATTHAVTFTGTSRPTKQVTLAPEFPGALMTPDGGSDNTGTMTSDFCSNGTSTGSIPAINATGNCSNAGEVHNFYKWTTSLATAQDYDIYIRWRVPDNFASWAASNPVKVNARRSATGASDNVR